MKTVYIPVYLYAAWEIEVDNRYLNFGMLRCTYCIIKCHYRGRCECDQVMRTSSVVVAF
jgi:hypothetical protein